MVDFTGLTVIHNLEMVSEAERETYKQQVSRYLLLPAGGNWLDYIWIPDEITGFKKLVLYARRGTTDILRELHGISVTDVSMLHIDDSKVVFKALGVSPEGRREAAIGSHSLEGLKGERLSSAISTAETRAGRRLTLKFLGLGILDASEVNMDYHLDTSKASGVELAPQTMPFLPPITVVTPTVPLTAPGWAVGTITVSSDHGFKATVPDTTTVVVDNTPTENLMIPSGAIIVESVPQEPKKRKPRKKAVDLAAGAPVPPPADEPKYPQTAVELAVDPLVHKAAAELMPAPQASPAAETQEEFVERMKQLYANAKAELIARNGKPAPTQVNAAVPTQVVAAPVPEKVSTVPPTGTIQFPAPQQSAAPPAFPGQPTVGQQVEFRDKLNTYSGAILPKAGMMPSEGIGGPSAKLREYAKRMIGKDIPLWTVDDWRAFFDQMDTFMASNGAVNLVTYINDVLGVK